MPRCARFQHAPGAYAWRCDAFTSHAKALKVRFRFNAIEYTKWTATSTPGDAPGAVIARAAPPGGISQVVLLVAPGRAASSISRAERSLTCVRQPRPKSQSGANAAVSAAAPPRTWTRCARKGVVARVARTAAHLAASASAQLASPPP